MTVTGRIDLIRHLDTDAVSVVDFKSSERAQTEDATRDLVSDDLLDLIRAKVDAASQALRENRLPRLGAWCTTCASCDFAATCRDRG